jgi:hypothetical protein
MSSKDETSVPKRPRERLRRLAGDVDDQEDVLALRTGRFRPTRLEDVGRDRALS